MLDVDGTLIPYDYAALPSAKVAAAIKKAKEKVEICLVTGRSYATVKQILAKLQVTSGFAVINNGAYVVDIATHEVVHEQIINKSDTQEIISLFLEEQMPFSIKEGPFESENVDRLYKLEKKITKASMFFTEEIFSVAQVDKFLERLKHNSRITIHKSQHKDRTKAGINITHVNATKLHGVHKVAERLFIDPSEMIGIGDSYNDFPLLMACGLKVAMGNAIDDLKAIADYVAPSVHEDGVADVIEKFIFTPTP